MAVLTHLPLESARGRRDLRTRGRFARNRGATGPSALLRAPEFVSGIAGFCWRRARKAARVESRVAWAVNDGATARNRGSCQRCEHSTPVQFALRGPWRPWHCPGPVAGFRGRGAPQLGRQRRATHLDLTRPTTPQSTDLQRDRLTAIRLGDDA